MSRARARERVSLQVTMKDPFQYCIVNKSVPDQNQTTTRGVIVRNRKRSR